MTADVIAFAPHDGIRHVTIARSAGWIEWKAKGEERRDMGVGSKGVQARRRIGFAATIALGIAVGPMGVARANTLCLLPSCWAVRADHACELAPTTLCLGDTRLRALDQMMAEDPAEGLSELRLRTFDLAIASPDAAQRRRIADLAARWKVPEDNFARAVRAFTEPRFDWRVPLAAGDFAGALAAMPAPDLPVSDRWLRPVLDAIFDRALAAGRGGEVLDGLADGRPTWAEWGEVRAGVLRSWFERVTTRAPDLLDRLIGLADPLQARSFRLARAAIDADPSAIGRAVAIEFPTEGAVDDDGERAIWDAFGLLETRPAEVRERFLDALPRSVSAEFTGSKGASLDGPVIRGERGVVERLVARTLPHDAATSVFLWSPEVRSAAIARAAPALDPPDRTDADLLMAQASIAENRVADALAILARPESRERLFGKNDDQSRADALARALLSVPPTDATRDFFRRFARLGAERVEAVKTAWVDREKAKRMLKLLDDDFATLSRGALFEDVEDTVLAAAWEEASARRDCRAMNVMSRNRRQPLLARLRDLDWVASCVAFKEMGR